jgi:hypothetical protein
MHTLKDARQELVDALAALRADLATAKKKSEVRELNQQIRDMEREIVVRLKTVAF